MSAANCITHHHSCDCREQATRDLVFDLLSLALEGRAHDCAYHDPTQRYLVLKQRAQELGYIPARTGGETND